MKNLLLTAASILVLSFAVQTKAATNDTLSTGYVTFVNTPENDATMYLDITKKKFADNDRRIAHLKDLVSTHNVNPSYKKMIAQQEDLNNELKASLKNFERNGATDLPNFHAKFERKLTPLRRHLAHLQVTLENLTSRTYAANILE